MAMLIHGMNYKYEDTDGAVKTGCFGYYSMCLGGLQNNIPLNMAMDFNETILDEYCDLEDEDEMDFARDVIEGNIDMPEGFIIPDVYSMTIWPLCRPDYGKLRKPEDYMPLGSKWQETIMLDPASCKGTKKGCNVEEYLKFLRFFCYRTRFAPFFVNLPAPSKLTAKWISENGIELDFKAGSERDFSFAYTTVRAITKINCGNYKLWCALEQEYTTDLQKLVLWHTLQQGSFIEDIFEKDGDGCHCICISDSFLRKGYAYRVMYPKAGEPTLYDTGKVASNKSQYFLVDYSVACSERNEFYIYRRGNTPEFRSQVRELVLAEIATCAGMRAANVWKDK